MLRLKHCHYSLVGSLDSQGQFISCWSLTMHVAQVVGLGIKNLELFKGLLFLFDGNGCNDWIHPL
jgi:hypothetical protein